MKYTALVLFSALLLATGCRTEPKAFTLAFTMESINNYRIHLSIDSNQHYRLEEQNLFFATPANTQAQEAPHDAGNAQVREGILTSEEWDELKTLLRQSRLFEMDDAYGFSNEADEAMENLLYQIKYTADGKEKYISIRPNRSDTFPAPFLQLLHFLTSLPSHQQ